MNWYKKAQTNQAPQIPQVIMKTNLLDGKTNNSARNIVRKIAHPYTQGLFSDQSWEAINNIWTALDSANINYHMTDATYYKDEQGNPSSKTWRFEVNFTNKNNKPTVLYGDITAHGAGSINYPLDKYDITFNLF